MVREDRMEKGTSNIKIPFSLRSYTNLKTRSLTQYSSYEPLSIRMYIQSYEYLYYETSVWHAIRGYEKRYIIRAIKISAVKTS